MIKEVLAQIAEMKQSFPFNIEMELQDDDWLFSKAAMNKNSKDSLMRNIHSGQDMLRMMLSSVGIMY